MKIAIMQPYLFPYIGYFQLISAVDKFVIYDDVNFIKKGWINRNRILLNGKEHQFTLPLEKVSQNKLINQINIVNNQKHKKELLELFRHAYSKAPEYPSVFSVIKEIVLNKENNLLRFLEYSLIRITGLLGLKTKFLLSSGIDKNSALKGADKIVDICGQMHVDHYINPIGGIDIYHRQAFEKQGIKLSFLKTKEIEYKQFKNDFISNLSIVDVLMFNTRNKIREFLNEYELI